MASNEKYSIKVHENIKKIKSNQIKIETKQNKKLDCYDRTSNWNSILAVWSELYQSHRLDSCLGFDYSVLSFSIYIKVLYGTNSNEIYSESEFDLGWF